MFNGLGTAPNRRCATISTRTTCRNCSSPPARRCSAIPSISLDDRLQPNYQTEATIFGKHILATKPDAKIGVLYQNDGFGKDYLLGLKAGLGPITPAWSIKEGSYENSEPTVDSQVVTLQGSGADVFLIAATPKFAAQAIRKTYDIGWTPVRYITDVSVSIAAVLKAAGLEKAKGLITANYAKDASDPRWKDDPGFKAFADFVEKYMTANDLIDSNAVYG